MPTTLVPNTSAFKAMANSVTIPQTGRTGINSFEVAGEKSAVVFFVVKPIDDGVNYLPTGLMRVEDAICVDATTGAQIAGTVCVPDPNNPAQANISGLGTAARNYLITVIGAPNMAGN